MFSLVIHNSFGDYLFSNIVFFQFSSTIMDLPDLSERFHEREQRHSIKNDTFVGEEMYRISKFLCSPCMTCTIDLSSLLSIGFTPFSTFYFFLSFFAPSTLISFLLKNLPFLECCVNKGDEMKEDLEKNETWFSNEISIFIEL